MKERKGDVGIGLWVSIIIALLVIVISLYFGRKALNEGSSINTCTSMGGEYVPEKYCNKSEIEKDNPLLKIPPKNGLICCPTDKIDQKYYEEKKESDNQNKKQDSGSGGNKESRVKNSQWIIYGRSPLKIEENVNNGDTIYLYPAVPYEFWAKMDGSKCKSYIMDKNQNLLELDKSWDCKEKKLFSVVDILEWINPEKNIDIDHPLEWGILVYDKNNKQIAHIKINLVLRDNIDPQISFSDTSCTFGYVYESGWIGLLNISTKCVNAYNQPCDNVYFSTLESPNSLLKQQKEVWHLLDRSEDSFKIEYSKEEMEEINKITILGVSDKNVNKKEVNCQISNYVLKTNAKPAISLNNNKVIITCPPFPDTTYCDRAVVIAELNNGEGGSYSDIKDKDFMEGEEVTIEFDDPIKRIDRVEVSVWTIIGSKSKTLTILVSGDEIGSG